MSAQHFLVPIDFSDSSDRALDCAIELGKKLQARLTLLHVVYLPRLAEIDLSPYQEEMETDAKKALESCLKRVRDGGLEATIEIVHGVPFREIVDMTNDRNIDLIIMGTHGRTGLQHAFLGSVAEIVVRLAPCPVLVARQSGETPG